MRLYQWPINVAFSRKTTILFLYPRVKYDDAFIFLKWHRRIFGVCVFACVIIARQVHNSQSTISVKNGSILQFNSQWIAFSRLYPINIRVQSAVLTYNIRTESKEYKGNRNWFVHKHTHAFRFGVSFAIPQQFPSFFGFNLHNSTYLAGI